MILSLYAYLSDDLRMGKFLLSTAINHIQGDHKDVGSSSCFLFSFCSKVRKHFFVFAFLFALLVAKVLVPVEVIFLLLLLLLLLLSVLVILLALFSKTTFPEFTFSPVVLAS